MGVVGGSFLFGDVCLVFFFCRTGIYVNSVCLQCGDRLEGLICLAGRLSVLSKLRPLSLGTQLLFSILS